MYVNVHVLHVLTAMRLTSTPARSCSLLPAVLTQPAFALALCATQLAVPLLNFLFISFFAAGTYLVVVISSQMLLFLHPIDLCLRSQRSCPRRLDIIELLLGNGCLTELRCLHLPKTSACSQRSTWGSERK